MARSYHRFLSAPSHATPDLRTDSGPLFLKRPCDRTLDLLQLLRPRRPGVRGHTLRGRHGLRLRLGPCRECCEAPAHLIDEGGAVDPRVRDGHPPPPIATPSHKAERADTCEA